MPLQFAPPEEIAGRRLKSQHRLAFEDVSSRSWSDVEATSRPGRRDDLQQLLKKLVEKAAA